jgi:predicted amidohydrolase YtcJ
MKTALATLLVLLAGVLAGRAQDADLILVNGTVYTVDPARPWAEAVAIAGDRIAAVGTSADVRRRAGRHARIIDLRGAFVSPGFNDAHVHVDSTGALLTGANLLDVHDQARFVERLRGAVERLPKGSWITRGDWGAYEQWGAGSAGQPASGRAGAPFMPDRSYVDPVTPDHPVFVSRFDRSAFFANALALRAAGISEATVAPPGGEIAKDASGRLTGVLKGAAADLVASAVPPVSFAQRLAQVRAVLREAREGGVTTLQDLTTAPQLGAYQELRRRGELTARLLLRPQLWEAPHVAALGVSRAFGDEWLKFIGFKAWVDGIMGSSGALFFEPYAHDPGNRGYPRHIMFPEGAEGAALRMTQGQRYTDFGPGNLEKLIEQAADTGMPPHVHAIGDKANRILLDVYERVLTRRKMVDGDHRWRVIHAQVVHPDDFARFGALKLVAEVNPYHVSDDMRWMEERIGKERNQGAYAFRKLKDAGAVLIFGSDSPGTNAARYPLSPVYGLYAAVTRQTLEGEPAGGWFPDQRLRIEEAIDAYTRAPAWASFEEDRKGTISPGKLADLAVFDTNLVDAGRSDPRALLRARVRYTIVGGRIVYEAGR